MVSVPTIIWRYRGAALAIVSLLVAFSSGVSGCKKSEPAAQQEQVKRYHLVGKVVSIDQQGATLNVDGQEIPGFMAAMTMPYPVKDKQSLSTLNPGDEITADVVVGSDGAYLENIVVTKKAAPGAGKPSGASSHQPQPGESVPDFAFIDQDAKRIHLSAFRGDVVLVTFIYTRCPFPDFCPLVSKNFAHVYAETQSNPALRSKLSLLSVSFDSAHDTPPVLRKFGESFRSITGDEPFKRWEFAVVPKNELKEVTSFFGVSYTEDKDQFVHSMSTSVITPDGKIYSWHEDTDWKPEELITDATEALLPDAERTMASDHGAGHEIAPPVATAN